MKNPFGLVASLLGVAFIVLKLCHVINWSWWLVTIPLWGGFGLLLVIGIAWVCWQIFKKK